MWRSSNDPTIMLVGSMTDQGDQLAHYGSLRDVLRAIDQDEDDFAGIEGSAFFSGAGGASFGAAPVTSTALVSRIERLPAIDGLGSGEADEMPPMRWRDRSWVPGTALAMAVPVMGTLFAGSLLIAPVPNADWARAALNEIWIEQPAPELFTLANSAEGNLPDTGIQAFAVLGQRALTASDGHLAQATAGYGLSAKPVIEARPGETIDLPFSISGAERPAGTKLILRGVPENAALSSAEPQADGNWAVSIDRVSEVKLTAYALPIQQGHDLVAELRTEAGELLAHATTKLISVGDASTAPVAAIADWATIMSAPAAPQAIAVQKASHPVEPSASEQSRETPEWVQPSKRSALGGPN